ncbi:MAG: ATP-binding protein [Actinomycetota bacterium]
MSSHPPETVSAQIPARGEFVHVLRSVAASAAARMNLSVDAIDDLRLSVDEACAELLKAVPSGSVLELSILRTGIDVEVVVSVDGDPGAWPPNGHERTLAWQVLSGLSDEVTFERSSSGPALRIRMHAVLEELGH